MGEIVKFNKDALIEELKQIHKEMVSVYKELFTYKYENNEDFRNFIEKEYRENGIRNDDKEKWNENFCHRTSYTLINKVLFIRICEDNRFMFNPEEDFIMGEPKDPNIGKKLSARGRDRWISLISNYTFGELLKFAFADMKESFKNIALFKEDKYEKLNPTKQELELKFMLDSKEYKKTPIYSYEENVAKIIEKLDTSKFDFNVPAEGNILGDVYEKFMDRETRKAIGQFYTPDFVIEYILNNTVAEADVVENPFVSVLDPACGSGHFLIMTYDILKKKFEENIDRLREKYADVDYVYKNENMKGKEYWVKDRIHYHILKHCIFGADIDSFAVQLTTINLLLKDLDNFTDELNIMECDSLIKREEDYDWQDLKQQLKNISMFYTINYKDINGIHRHDTLSRDKAEELVRLCEFWTKKYDYVVGNPPYIPITQISEKNKFYYKNKYRSSEGRTNTFVLFLERAISKRYPTICFIIPSRILLNTQYTVIRECILTNTHIKKIADLSEGVFEDAVVDTIIIILSSKQNNEIEEYVTKIDKFTPELIEHKEINQNNFLKFDNLYINIYATSEEINLLNKIRANSIKLGDIADIRDGIIQGAVGDRLFLGKKYISDVRCKRVLYGENINKYQINWGGEYIYYDKEYLTMLEDKRTKGKGRGLRLREPNIFERKKILTRQTSDKIIAAFDEDNFYYMNTLHGTHIVNNNYDDLYVLAVMNSNLTNFYYTRYNYEVDKTFAQVKIENLKNFPIIKISKEKQQYIAVLSKKIIELLNYNENFKINASWNKAKILNEYVNYMRGKEQKILEYYKLLYTIDFSLYNYIGLNDSEIRLIEKANGKLTREKNYIIDHILKNQNYTYNCWDSVIDYFLPEAMSRISKEEFIRIHVIMESALEEIADSYDYELITIIKLKEKYTETYGYNEPWKFYNLSELYIAVNEYLKNKTIEILKHKNKYINLDDIRNILEDELDNFEEIMNIMRKDKPTKKSKDIVKEALNQFADTWNSYIKNINAGKEPKKLVKYYDSTYYGLSEWDDEIHKEYFIDAIKKYTEINPNEKKARDILKLFEGLNIKDKEDYIEIFNSQIKKAFRK